MFDITIKNTDSPFLVELKNQAIAYINEYKDNQLRCFRYLFISTFIKSCEDIIDKCKEDFSYNSGATYDDTLFSCFTKLENILPYLQSRTPFVFINFNDSSTWLNDKCIYSENITRTKKNNKYIYYNKNAYNVKVLKIYDMLNKNIYAVSDEYQQHKLYLINEDSVIDGQYIDTCEFIKDETYIDLPIIIPSIEVIVKINDKNQHIYAAQYNISELNLLRNYYTVDIKEDKDIVETPIHYLDIWYN